MTFQEFLTDQKPYHESPTYLVPKAIHHGDPFTMKEAFQMQSMKKIFLFELCFRCWSTDPNKRCSMVELVDEMHNFCNYLFLIFNTLCSMPFRLVHIVSEPQGLPTDLKHFILASELRSSLEDSRRKWMSEFDVNRLRPLTPPLGGWDGKL